MVVVIDARQEQKRLSKLAVCQPWHYAAQANKVTLHSSEEQSPYSRFRKRFRQQVSQQIPN